MAIPLVSVATARSTHRRRTLSPPLPVSPQVRPAAKPRSIRPLVTMVVIEATLLWHPYILIHPCRHRERRGDDRRAVLQGDLRGQVRAGHHGDPPLHLPTALSVPRERPPRRRGRHQGGRKAPEAVPAGRERASRDNYRDWRSPPLLQQRCCRKLHCLHPDHQPLRPACGPAVAQGSRRGCALP